MTWDDSVPLESTSKTCKLGEFVISLLLLSIYDESGSFKYCIKIVKGFVHLDGLQVDFSLIFTSFLQKIVTSAEAYDVTIFRRS